jgi:hypothetical protein
VLPVEAVRRHDATLPAAPRLETPFAAAPTGVTASLPAGPLAPRRVRRDERP